MNIKTIDLAIEYLCQEINNKKYKAKLLKDLSEEDIIYELLIALLGSQTKYEFALCKTEQLKNYGLILNPKIIKNMNIFEKDIINIMSKPMYRDDWNINGCKYRFYNSRSNFIIQTFRNLRKQKYTIKEILLKQKNSNEARNLLINLVYGFGPKQASHFLKNIGFDNNLAVIDVHIMHYLLLKQILDKKPKYLNKLVDYLKIEHLLRCNFLHLNYPLGLIDQAIWIVMRVYQKEYI